jgi:hypothetical protein
MPPTACLAPFGQGKQQMLVQRCETSMRSSAKDGGKRLEAGIKPRLSATLRGLGP